MNETVAGCDNTPNVSNNLDSALGELGGTEAMMESVLSRLRGAEPEKDGSKRAEPYCLIDKSACVRDGASRVNALIREIEIKLFGGE